MATVRMSKTLVSSLCDEYGKNYSSTVPKLELDPALGDKLYDKYIKPTVSKLEEVVNNSDAKVFNLDTLAIFQRDTEIGVLLYTDEWEEGSEGNFDNLSWDMRQHVKSYKATGEIEKHVIKFPISVERLQLAGEYRDSATVNLSDVNDCPLVSEARTVANEYLAYNYKRQNAICKFAVMLLRFQTLNQALKAWPGGGLASLVEKVDPTKMVTIHKKQQRTVQAKKDKNFVEENATEFNSVILGSTLLGDDD